MAGDVLRNPLLCFTPIVAGSGRGFVVLAGGIPLATPEPALLCPLAGAATALVAEKRSQRSFNAVSHNVINDLYIYNKF